jgi:hypothetical protein
MHESKKVSNEAEVVDDSSESSDEDDDDDDDDFDDEAKDEDSKKHDVDQVLDESFSERLFLSEKNIELFYLFLSFLIYTEIITDF